MVAVPIVAPETLAFLHVDVVLGALGLALALAFPWLLIWTGAWRRGQALIGRWAGGRSLVAAGLSGAAYGVVWSLMSALIELARRWNRLSFHISPTQDWTAWLFARGATMVEFALVGLALAPVAYALIRWSPRRWPLWSAAALSLLAYGLIAASPLTADTTPLPNGPLKSGIDQMLRKAGRPEAPLVLMRNSGPCVGGENLGVFPTTRIVLDDGYLSIPPRQGVETAAHELGHWVRHDPELGVAIGIVWIFVGLIGVRLGGLMLVRAVGGRLGVSDLSGPASLPVLIFCATLAYEAGTPAFNFIQRQVEHRADAFAMQLTHDGEAGAVQMVRDTACDRLDPNPDLLARTLFWNHPSIAERIQFMNRYAPTGADASRSPP